MSHNDLDVTHPEDAAAAGSLAERMREHVMSRGGPAMNGAWQMMLDAANRMDRLEEALAFYAHPTSYMSMGDWADFSLIDHDRGHRAQTVLGTSTPGGSRSAATSTPK